MKLSDISLRKRLLAGNFLMVLLPVCLLSFLGWLVFAGIHAAGIGEQSRMLSLLWPEKGPALSVQLAASSIRAKVERKDHLKMKDIQKDFRALEENGIAVMVLQNGKEIYHTLGTDRQMIQDGVETHCGKSSSSLLWDRDVLAFRYVSPAADFVVMACGMAPPAVSAKDAGNFIENLAETIGTMLLILAIVLIIALGCYLSRLLSQQILEPLARLRQASEEIRRGNLDAALPVDSRDELGATCKAFEDMRLELKYAREMQGRYEANRKELLAGISHDLATPITALKGYASGILDGIARTPEKQRHYVEMMAQTISGMERLVDSLFYFSKLDLGKIPFQPEPVCLQSYFKDFIAENGERLAERGLQLDFTGETAGTVNIDRLQFARLVDNLLENSIKYKKKASVRMVISLKEEYGDLTIRFADNGCGVATESLPKLFDSFYRADPARSESIKGSGLGLSIVKQIVLGMKGKIWAEATPGGGLTIVIRLPYHSKKEDAYEKNIAD